MLWEAQRNLMIALLSKGEGGERDPAHRTRQSRAANGRCFENRA